jgi:hypothetical protein
LHGLTRDRVALHTTYLIYRTFVIK